LAEGKAGFYEEDCASRILDEKRLSNNGKLGNVQPHQSLEQPQLQCPECSSKRLYRAGLRYLKNGAIVQRWLCRDCGFRFSESPANSQVKVNISAKVLKEPNPRKNLLQANVFQSDFPLKPTSEDSPFKSCEHIASHTSSKQTITEKVLNTFADYNRERQVRATKTTEVINLTEVAESRQEKAAGATKPDAETVKGLITQYAYWLEKEGYYEKSRYLGLIRQLVKLGVNLFDPESVKATIARQRWKNGTRILAVYAYDIMATKILHVEWTRPKYTQEETLPFIPEEAELDQLIAACRSRRMAAYLQTLKETFADPGEALRLRWIDFSAKDNTITINKPVKRHSPRQLQISNKLATMLNALPRNSKCIFPTTYRAVCKGFQRIKRRVASNIENPRLLSITLRTFRHWGATMTYHYTKNILLVQKLLGHKNIRNTLKYTQLIHFKDDEFDVATATTLEEAKELLAAGFNYITEMKGVKLFRRPKRFNG